MANFVNIGNGVLVGASTDTKPTAPAGYVARETDTGDTLMSDGTYWWLVGQPSALSPRRTGFLSPGPSISNGQIGLLSALTAATGAGGTNNTISFTDTTNGRYFLGISGTTTGNRGGARQGNIVTTRGMSPKLVFKFKLVSTTSQNFWLGFIGGGPTELAGADPFGAGASGIVFGVSTTVATNWAIMYNDAAGATVIDNTGIAYDTNVHTVKIVGDDANTKFMWSLDNAAYVALGTPAAIPSQTNSLGVIAEIETQDSGVAKSFQLYQMAIQTEK
jgi:hypothetical protein